MPDANRPSNATNLKDANHIGAIPTETDDPNLRADEAAVESPTQPVQSQKAGTHKKGEQADRQRASNREMVETSIAHGEPKGESDDR